MNIKFEEIIERANKRKEALQALQDHFQGLADAVSQLDEAIGYFEAIAPMIREVDAEGKELLGSVNILSQYAAERAKQARQSFFGASGNVTNKLLLTLCAEVAK